MKHEHPQHQQHTPLYSVAYAAQPGERIGGWSEPSEEPILDAARVSLKAFRANKPLHSATGMYIWLHLLRPGLLILFWIGMGAYVWRHLLQPTERPESMSLLAIYGGLILLIFLAMLLLAPFRRHAHRDSRRAAPTTGSSMAELAAYADLPSRNLSGWQHARRLVVHHDEDGRLRNASDLDTVPRQWDSHALQQRRAA